MFDGTVIESSWSPARVEQLTTLWAEGRSAAQIALAMGEGLTRSAVIGKVYRLNLPKRKTVHAPRQYTAAPRNKKSLGGSNRATRISDKRKFADAPVPEIRADPIVVIYDADIVGIPLIALTEHTCKWPIGDPLLPGFRFCGCEPLEKKPYCAAHHARAFQSIDKKAA
jgi:GcrA cell cycle regulator